MTDPPIDCTTIRRYGAGERARIDEQEEKDGGVCTQRNFPFLGKIFHVFEFSNSPLLCRM